jgi:hypothetical protein
MSEEACREWEFERDFVAYPVFLFFVGGFVPG